MSEVREGKCICGNLFPIPIKRGRPPVRCAECREAYSNGTLPDRLMSLGIDPHTSTRRRINSDPTSTPSDEINKPLRPNEIEISEELNKARERVDRLEFHLKLRGQHISQHQDKW